MNQRWAKFIGTDQAYNVIRVLLGASAVWLLATVVTRGNTSFADRVLILAAGLFVGYIWGRNGAGRQEG